MIICLAGKNEIAIDIASYIKANYPDIELIGIVNEADKGVNGYFKSYKWFLDFAKIKEYTLEDIYNIDNLLFLSLEFDKIISPSKFRSKKLFNLHFSYLPAYKGMYTSAWPILNCEKFSGVTLHEIDRGIDTGNMVAQEKIYLSSSETVQTLYKKYMHNGTLLVKSNLKNLIDGTVKSFPQAVVGSTYFSKKSIDYQNINIRLDVTAYQLDAQIRAFTYREYQIVSVFGKKINRCNITNEKSNSGPGKILEENEYSMKISTIDYDVILFKDRFPEFIDACKNNNISLVKQLFDETHLEDKTNEGWTPLIAACYNNSVDCVSYLLEMGADVNAINYKGTTVLMYAKDAVLNTNQYSILILILKYKPDTYTKDFFGRDIFYYLKEQSTEIANFIKNYHD